jgi:hypothetical protein
MLATAVPSWWPLVLLARGALGHFDLTRGNDLVVKNSGTSHVSVAHFDEDAGVVCYADWGDGGRGTCNLLTLTNDGQDLVAGQDLVVTEGEARYIATTHFSGSSVVMCYVDVDNDERGTCTTLLLSGGALERGEDLLVSETSTGLTFISVRQVDESTGVMCYSDTGSTDFGACTCIALFLEGSLLEKSDELVVSNAAFSSSISLTRHSDISVIACYSNADDGYGAFSRCSLLELHGISLVEGDVIEVTDTSSSYISVASISDDAAVVCWSDPDEVGICSTLAVSGQTITCSDGALGTCSEGEFTVVNEATTSHLSVASPSTDEAIVCFADDGNGSVGTCLPLGNDGMALTTGESLVVSDAGAAFLQITSFSAGNSVVCYAGPNQPITCTPLGALAWSTTETTTTATTTSPHTTTDTSTEFTRSLTSTTTWTLQTTSATWDGMTASLVSGVIEMAVSSLAEFAQDAGARAGVLLAVTHVAGVPDSYVNFGQSVARSSTAESRRLEATDAVRVAYEILVPPEAPEGVDGSTVRGRLATASLTELTAALQSHVNQLATSGPYTMSVTGASEPNAWCTFMG